MCTCIINTSDALPALLSTHKVNTLNLVKEQNYTLLLILNTSLVDKNFGSSNLLFLSAIQLYYNSDH